MPIENHRLGRVVLQRSVHVLNHFRALSAKLIVYILTVADIPSTCPGEWMHSPERHKLYDLNRKVIFKP